MPYFAYGNAKYESLLKLAIFKQIDLLFFLEQWFSTVEVLAFTLGNLASWRQFWLSQIGDSPGAWLVDAGNAGEHAHWTGLFLTSRNYLDQNANTAEIKKP